MQVTYYDQNRYTGAYYNKDIQDHAILQRQGDIAYFVFPALSRISGIRHAFSTRLGGVSAGYCSSMNLADNCGDTKENLRENYRRMAALLGIRLEDIVLSDQVHGKELMVVSREHTMGEELEKKIQGIDGIMTDVKGIALSTAYADCVPLLFADRKKKVIAAVHAGWRGTVAEIAIETVTKLKKQYGCQERDLQVVIGPSICQNCYEVSEEVAVQFSKLLDKHDFSGYIESVVRKNPDKEEKYQLDLWMANRLLLEAAGIPVKNITTACVCTCCNKDLLHSHRASGGKRGGLRAFIMAE